MKIPLKWLNEFVDITIPVEELAEKLTMAGIEVSEMLTIGENWENVVVGKLIGVDAHPNADRLRLATVDLGKQQTTVVCGAPNLIVGDKIAFASVGAQLIDGDSGKVQQLKPAKIRGVISEGMICSEMELGISDRHEGIMVLPSEAPVGVPLAEYLGDTIIDLEITPNRPDCLSVVGIAREAAALIGNKPHIPEIHYDESEDAIDSYISVEIDEPTLCPRYCASLLTGVRVAPSPQWLQQRLLACGMRPINNIVDVTNYVMLEYGQPLHAFDYEKIKGKQIIVRRAQKDETITSLDGADRTLSQNMLVIADRERAVAVAGVMGGVDTEVTDHTTSVLIEAANFNQAIIHRGSMELRLSSEASLRFGKGLSRDLPLEGLKRATQLMLEVTGGKVAKDIIDVYPGKIQVDPIMLMAAKAERLLGMEIEIGEMVRVLELLGFNCEQTEASSQVRVHIPWWRTDIDCIADLAEEIARIIGYDNIPTTTLSSSLPKHEPIPMLSLRQKLSSTLVSCGFQEILTYALTSLEMMSKLFPQHHLMVSESMKVVNPMTREQEHLRTNLRTGVLSVLARNQRHQEKDIRLFEVGKVFFPQKGDLPREQEMLCAVLESTQLKLSWRSEAESVDFFSAKGVVETILYRLGLEANFEVGKDESLYPGRNADIVVGDDRIGVVGELHPIVSKAFELSETAYLIELDLEKLLSIAARRERYLPVSRFPSITRDIALLVDEKIIYKQIHDIIQDFPLVNQVTLFDFYSGEQVPSGKKSLAFSIVYSSPSHTLTNEEVDNVQQQILDRLSNDLGVTLRS